MIEKKDLNITDSFLEAASLLAVYQIKTAWNSIQKLGDKISKKHDLTLSIVFILLAIYEDEGTPVTKIAPRIGLEPNSLSRVLKTMENKGFIHKVNSKNDKRIVLIQLSELGKRQREISLLEITSIENDLINDIDTDDLAAFFRVMTIINKKLSSKTKQKSKSSLL